MLGATAHGPVPYCHDNSEGTDVVTFVEDFEGKISSVLIGDWLDDVAERLWSLAERCINGKRKKRPTSTEVSYQLPSHVSGTWHPLWRTGTCCTCGSHSTD